MIPLTDKSESDRVVLPAEIKKTSTVVDVGYYGDVSDVFRVLSELDYLFCFIEHFWFSVRKFFPNKNKINSDKKQR